MCLKLFGNYLNFIFFNFEKQKNVTNIKLTCSREMTLRFLLSCVPHPTSKNFKIITVIHMLTTAIFKLKF
jgi:hypothetical protein